mgnify:CR=1 FL=1
MYFVGINISKYKHDCFITTETGIVITQNLSFSNNIDVFDKFFLNLLKLLYFKVQLTNILSFPSSKASLVIFFQQLHYLFYLITIPLMLLLI